MNTDIRVIAFGGSIIVGLQKGRVVVRYTRLVASLDTTVEAAQISSMMTNETSEMDTSRTVSSTQCQKGVRFKNLVVKSIPNL